MKKFPSYSPIQLTDPHDGIRDPEEFHLMSFLVVFLSFWLLLRTLLAHNHLFRAVDGNNESETNFKYIKKT